MARKRERVTAIIIAVLFFGFSFATSFAVIWQVYKDHKGKAVNDTSNSSTNSNSSSSENAGNNGKLQGTKLKNFTPVAHIDSLQTTDTTVGNGSEAKAGDTVIVDYTGAVAATGVIFQSSQDSAQPAQLSLNSVIQGWKDGIPGMKAGGTRRILIPAAQAYGANPPSGSGIPANADLVFDVTLESVGSSEN
jgi:FKBP-type peptidyl-prolyl cis-trans isomerase